MPSSEGINFNSIHFFQFQESFIFKGKIGTRSLFECDSKGINAERRLRNKNHIILKRVVIYKRVNACVTTQFM